MRRDQRYMPSPMRLTAASLISFAADRFGDDEFLVTPEERLSYSDAQSRSRELAARMVGAGLGKASRVGILLPNGISWGVSWLAAARIGALTMPLSTYLTADELGRILRHADIQVLITAPRILGRDVTRRLEHAVPGLAETASRPRLHLPAVPSLRTIWTWGDPGRPWGGPIDELDDSPCPELLDALEAAVSPSDPLAVVHTSGSTAAPKGVIHTNASLIRHAARLAQHAPELHRDDRVYSPNPFFWVGGLTHVFLGVMHTGAAALVEESFDAERSLRFVARERMTVFLGQPHARAALRAAAGRLSVALPDVRMMEHPRSLGMTETAGSHVAQPRPGSDSFGSPVPGIEHLIADPDAGAALPPGRAGEIWVRGEDLCLGQLRRERHEVFDADGWYHTGDWGWFDQEGELHFAGRRTEMIKTKGMNVAPQEVEQALKTLPWVAGAVVVGLADPELGQLVAALVAGRPETQLPANASDALKGLLSSYKVPRVIRLVRPDEVPVLASGKVDKVRVAEMLEAQRTGAAGAEGTKRPSP